MLYNYKRTHGRISVNMDWIHENTIRPGLVSLNVMHATMKILPWEKLVSLYAFFLLKVFFFHKLLKSSDSAPGL